MTTKTQPDRGLIGDLTDTLEALVGPDLAEFSYCQEDGFAFEFLGLGLKPVAIEHQSIVGPVKCQGWQVWAATYDHGDCWTLPDCDIVEIGAPVDGLAQALGRVVGLYFEEKFARHLEALGERRHSKEPGGEE